MLSKQVQSVCNVSLKDAPVEMKTHIELSEECKTGLILFVLFLVNSFI